MTSADEKESDGTPREHVVAPDLMSLPYLLLDIRDSDAFEEGHIIGGVLIKYSREIVKLWIYDFMTF